MYYICKKKPKGSSGLLLLLLLLPSTTPTSRKVATTTLPGERGPISIAWGTMSSKHTHDDPWLRCIQMSKMHRESHHEHLTPIWTSRMDINLMIFLISTDFERSRYIINESDTSFCKQFLTMASNHSQSPSWPCDLFSEYSSYTTHQPILVGGFNPFEKSSSNWIMSTKSRGKNPWKKPPHLPPPPNHPTDLGRSFEST